MLFAIASFATNSPSHSITLVLRGGYLWARNCVNPAKSAGNPAAFSIIWRHIAGEINRERAKIKGGSEGNMSVIGISLYHTLAYLFRAWLEHFLVTDVFWSRSSPASEDSFVLHVTPPPLPLRFLSTCYFPFSRVSKRSDLISVIAAAMRCSLCPQNDVGGNATVQWAAKNRSWAWKGKREWIAELTFRQSSQIALSTHTHAHRFGEGGTEKSKTSLPFQTGQLTMILAYMIRICIGKLKKMFFPSSLFRNSLVSGSRCKYRTVAGLRGIRVRVNPGKIWGKNRRVSWGKGLIVSGSFFSELPTKKRFGETPKRGKASLLLSFFPFSLLQQSNN